MGLEETEECLTNPDNRIIRQVQVEDIKKANIISVDKIISYGLDNGYTFLPIDENSPIVHHKINN